MVGVCKKRVAVIGCGPCGMSFLCAMRAAEIKGEEIPEIVCFEKQSGISGLWNYTWQTGLDEHGEFVHGSMYRSLWSNGPKEALEMADYTYQEHFKGAIPSFAPRAALRDYLIGRTKKYNIDKFLRVNTVVRFVQEIDQSFSVIYENLKTHTSYAETFDYVVVANGHFSVPNFPIYPGIDNFCGRILHSHDFRKADEFKNQTVVVVGASYSAEDIALQLYKYGVKECIISYRKDPMNFKWPEGIREVPQIDYIKRNECFFKDGSSTKMDAIIFCTGYKHHFPFLSQNIKLSTLNVVYPDKLYKGVVYEGNDKVMYLGMQDQHFTFPMFDAQSWFARDYILGRVDATTLDERKKDMAIWYERSQNLKNVFDEIEFQQDYITDLYQFTDYPRLHLDGIVEMIKKWRQDKDENILTYRDKVFTSLLDGTIATKKKLPWIDVRDNSLEWFVNKNNHNEVIKC